MTRKRITIRHDSDPEKPDTLGKIIYKSSSRYILGNEKVDDHNQYFREMCADMFRNRNVPDTMLKDCARQSAYENKREYINHLLYYREQGYSLEDAWIDWINDHGGADECIDALQAVGYIILPAYAYIHGGVALSLSAFSCPWDSGQFGWVVVTPDDVAEWGTPADKVEECARASFETWAQYVSGDCYGFQIETLQDDLDEDDEDNDWTTDDSCWGFYGNDPDENGMADHVEESAHEAMREACRNIGVSVEFEG